MTLPILLATRSQGKLRELNAAFAAVGIEIHTLDDAGITVSAAEDGLEIHETFEGNALTKARWFHAVSGGRVVVADDSGLEVNALHGAPGVRSKRWSNRPELSDAALDAANNGHLLSQLEAAGAVAALMREARYVCAAACVWSHGEVVVRGETSGSIVRDPRGAHGFGYDPYFLSHDLGMTFAEAVPSEKARVSHRGRAFRALLVALEGRGVIWA